LPNSASIAQRDLDDLRGVCRAVLRDGSSAVDGRPAVFLHCRAAALFEVNLPRTEYANERSLKADSPSRTMGRTYARFKESSVMTSSRAAIKLGGV
jgi:hypothetical protein